MADSDLMPARGVPYRVTVDANGIAVGGTANVLQLAQKGMRPVCLVDANGLSGAVTIDQLRGRGIRAACLVDENGLVGGVTADTLRSRGIRPLVSLTAAGLSGSTTMLQLAQRGLESACLVNEAGIAGASVTLSNATVSAAATIGTTIGVLSTSGTTGSYTYALTSNPGSLFAISGANLNVAAALSAGTYPITVQASGGVPTPISQAFLIVVTAVVLYVPTYYFLGF
jgi:hypothetical protein